ncbi:MAG: ATPase, T2SS/T4P/T4SS family [Anaerolineae bacterium]
MSLLRRINASGGGSIPPRRPHVPSQPGGVYVDVINLLKHRLEAAPPEESITSWTQVYKNQTRYRPLVYQQYETAVAEEDLVMARAEKAKLFETLFSEIYGLGPLDKLLQDGEIAEIYVNIAKNVYVKQGNAITRSSAVFDDEEHVTRVADRIFLLGGITAPADGTVPLKQEVILPDGTRVVRVNRPASVTGTLLTIIKSSVITRETVLTRFGLTQYAYNTLIRAVKDRRSILICGTPGSGKTSLLNVLIQEIPPEDRVVVIERGQEIDMEVTNDLRLTVSDQHGMSAHSLIEYAALLQADRIIMGDLEGSEAALWLEAINRGSRGSLATLLARSPEHAIRLLMDSASRDFIASALDLIVYQARLPDGSRRITRICEVEAQAALADRFVFEETANQEGRISGELFPR